jgi:hypothetical protein
MKKRYEFLGMVVVHTLVAFYVSELMVTVFKRATNQFIAPPTTFAGAISVRALETVIFGFLLGLAAHKLTRHSGPLWVWATSFVWLLFGSIWTAAVISSEKSVLINGTPWGEFFDGPPGFIWFVRYLLPALSGFGYAFGAYALNLASRKIEQKNTAGARS